MILITGVSGYIGSHLASYFEKRKIDYIGIDNLSYSFKSNVPNKKKIFLTDISNVLKINYLLKKFKVTTIIHAAAAAYVIEAEIEKIFYFKNNIYKTKKFIDVCEENKIKNFIFLSSSNVYQEKKSKVAYGENDKIKPKNNYGKTKAIIEKYLNSKKFNNIIILRLFNVIGIFNKFFKIFKFKKKNYQRIIFKILQNKEKNIISNINYFEVSNKQVYPYRDFISINNLVIIIFKLIKKIENKYGIYEIFNVGSGKSTSIITIVNQLKKKYKDKISFKFLKISKKEFMTTKAKVNKLNRFINFSNQNDLSKIIRSYYR